MTDAEILKKAIKKAQKNGWYPDTKFTIIAYDGSIGTSLFLHGADYDDEDGPSAWHRDVETLIYQPYFAKAFFGEKETTYMGVILSGKAVWQHHLQRMVLEENPIQYLEAFL